MIVAVASAFSSPALADIAAAKIAAIIKPDQADRHLRRDERRKDVVDVGVAASPVVSLTIVTARARMSRTRRVAREKRRRASPRSAAALRCGDRLHRTRCCRRRVFGRMRSGGHLRVVGAVEQHRRRLKQVEDEHQHAGRRGSAAGAESSRTRSSSASCAPSSIRLRGEIPLHLALIAAEVRQHQEQAADAGPTRTCRSRADRT